MTATTAARKLELEEHELHIRLIANWDCIQDHALIACYRVQCRHCDASLGDHIPVTEIRLFNSAAIVEHSCGSDRE